MVSTRLCHKEILGIVLGLVLVFSVYVQFVQFSNGLFWHDFVEELYMSRTPDSGPAYQFKMGDEALVVAKVRDANAYSLRVLDKNGSLVFEDRGDARDGKAVAHIPIRSPAFSAGSNYTLAFDAGLLNSPFPGLSTYSSGFAAFQIVKSLTKVNSTAVYSRDGRSVRSNVLLMTDDDAPMENKTVGFYLMPEMELSRRDRGWIFLGSATTDENGSASFSFGVDIGGGCHGFKAKFLGDEDFGQSFSIANFTAEYKRARLNVVRLERSGSRYSLLLRLVSEYSFPLAGRLVSFEASALFSRRLYAISNETGYASVSFTLDRPQALAESKITILGDKYISTLESCATLNFSSLRVSAGSQGAGNGLGQLEAAEDNACSCVGEGCEPLAGQASVLSGGIEEVRVTVDPNPSVAGLDTKIYSELDSEQQYSGVKFLYYRNGTEYLGSVDATYTRVRIMMDEGWGYVYNYSGLLVKEFDYYGHNNITVYAVDSGNYTVGVGSNVVPTNSAPANIVAYFPGSYCDESLNLTLCFSRARTYEPPADSEFFQRRSMAPILRYGTTDYMLDVPPTNSTIVHLFVNSTPAPVCDLVTDSVTGLAWVRLNVSSDLRSFLIVRGSADTTSMYKGAVVERSFNLTRVSVVDSASGGRDQLTLNYSLSVLDGNETTFAGLNNTVRVEASLFGLPVYNVSASVVSARVVARSALNAYGVATIPGGCNYMRLKSACVADPGDASPLADVCKDGLVNTRDIGFVTGHFGSFGDSQYDWRADLNGDGAVDQDDLDIVTSSSNWGKDVAYLDDGGYDYSAVLVGFVGGGDRYPNRLGFTEIPTGATWFYAYPNIRAIVEFFEITFEGEKLTNNGGYADLTWCPSETGVYAFEVKLPSRLNLTATEYENVTSLSACLGLADYYYVLRRPVDLCLELPTLNITTIEAEADTYADAACPDTNFGNSLLMYCRGAFQRAFVRFSLVSIPQGARIVSARMNLFCESAGEAVFEVHRVTDLWSESTLTWNHQPSFEASASCTFSVPEARWVLLDVSEDVRNMSNESNIGFVLTINQTYSPRLEINTREAEDCHPTLEVSYVVPSGLAYVTAYDDVTREPIEGLHLNFSVNGARVLVCTNSSGVTWVNMGLDRNAVYNVSVSYEGNATLKESCVGDVLDCRYPTNMSSLDSVPLHDVAAGFSRQYPFQLVSSPCFGIEGRQVSFYVNGTCANGTAYYDPDLPVQNETDANGKVEFGWMASAGVFSIHAVFDGNGTYLPCEAYLLVNATIKPLAILLSVNCSEFEPGAGLRFNATVIDVFTSQRISSEYTVQVNFTRVDSNGQNLTYPTMNVTDGVALFNNSYPTDGKAYAYMARVVSALPGFEVPQGVASSPIQLTVSIATKLILNVSRDVNSTRHVVEGWLRRNGTGAAVSGKPITISVNDTRYGFTTDQYGYFVLDRDFPPVEDQNTTYTITALFEGDQPVNATAWAKTMDGTRFAACTTTQFGYKPAANSTSIRVEPPVTEKTVPTKSPEEMQKEAENDGSFYVKNEFGWWYPFYRLHLCINIPPLVEVIFAPLALDINLEIHDESYFAQKLEQAFGIGYGLALGYMTALLVAGFAAKVLGRSSFVALFLAIVAYVSASLLLAVFSNMNQKNAETWLIAFAASLISISNVLVRKFANFVKWGCTLISRVLGAIGDTFKSWWSEGLGWGKITAIPFMFADVALCCIFLHFYNQGVVI